MNRLQLVFILIALIAGGDAFMLMKSRPKPQIVAPVVTPPPATEQVLVATRDLTFGAQISDADLAWADLRIESIPGDALLRSMAPNLREEMKAAYVRTPIAKGEPIRRDRLAKAGLMSTMLTPGHRAAVAIDVTLNNTAGGFILQNDRVDVMRTYRNSESTQEAGHDVFSTEVVLLNIRVLAIGTTTERKGAESTATGPTATLELTPHQTEIVLMAQKSGQLSLALRPNSNMRTSGAKADAAEDQQDSADVTIVRRGVVSTLRAR